ncbi:D-erythritol 1-phosphate dehydrogenase, partial [Aduncisulcus paluster]
AAFGGTDIRCAGYARYGTKELSDHAIAALEGRNGCLLANHGMIALGANLDKAMWLAVELETIARQYYLSLALDSRIILSDEEIADTAKGFSTYGLQAPKPSKAPMKGTAPVAGRDHGLVDIAVIGGGINGAGIARDAAGRGLKVLLCEKDDFAEGTSSRSGKLIHGGLRYLEYYEFRLVREALIERERPAWLVRTGLLLYDHLGGRKQLPASRGLDLSQGPEGAPLRQEFRRGFEYSDCWVDDSRLVILNLIDAARNGACILSRTRALRARRDGETWLLEMQGDDGTAQVVRSRALVNAAGPWVQDVIQGVTGLNSAQNVRLVKGSH